VLDDVSPPASPGGVVVVEAAALPADTMVGDEASHLRTQLEAIQEAIARSEREAGAAVASRAEA
jgi:hypothetical protein